jgi:hypothetical protein
METLPFEVVEKIFELLQLKEMIKLRSVGPDWKAIAEDHLRQVKCIKSRPDLSCKFGCKHEREEICPEASDITIFPKIMALCPNVKQLCLDPPHEQVFTLNKGSIWRQIGSDAGAWDELISAGLPAAVKCLSWDGFELKPPLRAENLKHLSCSRISAAALTPVSLSLVC